MVKISWSYSGNPAASNLDEVRWWIGDTDTDDQQLQDAEINFAISATGDNKRAAAWCARALKAKYSREVDIRTGADGEFRANLSSLAKAYGELADFLESSAAEYAAPWSGAISIDDKNDQKKDSDRVAPFFDRALFSGKDYAGKETWDWNKYGLI